MQQKVERVPFREAWQTRTLISNDTGQRQQELNVVGRRAEFTADESPNQPLPSDHAQPLNYRKHHHRGIFT